jgi:hypothetical protein
LIITGNARGSCRRNADDCFGTDCD